MEWRPINERILTARFFSTYINVSIIQVCAQTKTNEASENSKEEFLEKLVIETIPKHDMLLIIGDFNVKIGAENIGYEGVMRREGVRIMNENGERLVNVCEIYGLVQGHSFFINLTTS